MYIFLIITFTNVFASSSDKQELIRYLKNYEIVDCYISGSRTKRNSFMNSERIKSSFDAEVRFKSYETYFHLLLTEDIAFKKLKVEFHSFNKSIQPVNITTKMFEGIAKTESVNSYVVGYLKDNVFTGSVNLNETLYFVEPARKLYSNYIFTNKIIVYREEDVIYESINYTRNFNDQVVIYNNKDVLPKGINRTGNDNTDYACVMEFVSDHTLYDYFGRDTNEIAAYLYLHGKYADFIFRRTDFDGDGKRDRIRIIVDKISIYKNKNDPNYPMEHASDMYTFLNLFSYRAQNYCLAVCISARIFINTVIGAAYKSSASVTKPPGGICQKPIEASYFFPRTRYLNTAVLPIKNIKGNTLPLSVTFLSLAHEIGHSFGSDHDPANNLLCSPDGDRGHYLMHSMSQNNLKPLSTFFSPCSTKTIASVIEARGECLKPHPATCGNAIQEGNEECDCGEHAFCQYVDKCCTPSDASPPEKGCTFHKTRKAACSPKEDRCCLNDCKINTDKNFQCHEEFSECRISYCDGKSRTCPKPKAAPDGYPCQGTSRTCSGGICNGSVCVVNSLDDCVCEDLELECYVCCKKAGKCVSASSLGFKTPDKMDHYVLEGSLCNFKRYQCDGSGNCINPHLRSLTTKKNKSIAFWLALGGLILALLILAVVLIYFVKFYPIKI